MDIEEFYLGGALNPTTGKHDPAKPVLYERHRLTTHGVIVGMTGSGKTGLGIIALEEALLSGIPVLAIDPKGDIGNLLLTFPRLDAHDFRPWIDEGEAHRKGEDVDTLAAMAKPRDRYRVKIGQVGSQLAAARRRIRDLEVDTQARPEQELIAGAGELLSALLSGKRGSRSLSAVASRRSQTVRTQEGLRSAKAILGQGHCLGRPGNRTCRRRDGDHGQVEQCGRLDRDARDRPGGNRCHRRRDCTGVGTDRVII